MESTYDQSRPDGTPAPDLSNPNGAGRAGGRRRFLGQMLAGTGAVLAVPAVPAGVLTGSGRSGPAQGRSGRAGGIDRPVVPANAATEVASFIDPTARLIRAGRITVEPRVYVGPFARLDAFEAPIAIGEESNVQDNVVVEGGRPRRRRERNAIAALGLELDQGVDVGYKVILAHGSRVIGPALIGFEGHDASPEHDVGVFLSFGAEVDGAILEQKTVVSALGRVGPGVRLRSGYVVLPGCNVETQADADDPSRGKVRLVTPADIAFNEAVIEVNTSLAREYTELFRDDPHAVTGINVDPGGTGFNPERNTPVLAGVPQRDPGFRNRVIGAVTLADPLDRLDDVMGRSIAVRADEGEPIGIGAIAEMNDRVTFHALEHTGIEVGSNVRFGRGCIVHGGNRTVGGVVVEARTVVGDDVVIGQGAVVFRSRIGSGCRLGAHSLVINTELVAGTRVADGTIIIDGAPAGTVQWRIG